MSQAPYKILFMCVANSARSQLAEGLAKKIFAGKADVRSAGSHPKSVNPFATKVMAEIGIDLTTHSSKTVEQLPKEFFESLDFLITLCAEEVCPYVPSQAKRLHWPLIDPAGDAGTEEEKLQRFRKTRAEVEERLKAFEKELA